MEKSANHPFFFHIFRIARENIWLKFWDVALEYGYDGSKLSLAILKSLCLTVFSDRHCPMQNCAYTVPHGVALYQHFFECHTEFDSSVTPKYITDCSLSSTSNSDQFMSFISLHLSLLKVLPFNHKFMSSSTYILFLSPEYIPSQVWDIMIFLTLAF